MEFLNYAIEHWDLILEAIGAFYVGVSIIAGLTPSDKDDTIVQKVGLFADRIGLNLKGK